MLAVYGSLALAQPAPCDDPPEEKPVVKCDAETGRDADRKIDLSALLGAPKAPVDPGCRRTTTTVVSGSPIGVTDRLASVDDALRHCAVAARERRPSLAGGVSFALTIDGQGQVSKVDSRSSTLDDDELVECFARALGTARFTPAERVVHVDVGCQTGSES